ncbi:alpha/beta fold hydrolase [Mycobacterium bourgelatii]|uniref:Hydrolase n=1 Tax=Mycobacterium bourgelatii TaxID=1273442 RepID=A0A7I9YJ59_MYCBU|nr:alpha/beta hydrolase [Mycobacterium bourgelatii]MCV6975415.1 alpha/beta hydrolase [Mycobacterium bourgelatii]GFG88715.1 hydrolase [Mycobacterium bourgelatii]
METFVQLDGDVRLWVCDEGRSDRSPLLLIMGANASALAWPPEFVEQLGRQHRVISYDHRDTGRSTWAFDEHPYAVADLAEDAVAVLDALGVARAHLVGMSLGGILVQLLLLDHPDRLLSATVLCSCALGVGAAATGDSSPRPDLPGPDPRLLALWEQMNEPRDRAAELEWRVEHWRILNGGVIDFDADDFRRLEERTIQHAGRYDNPAAHARADQRGLDRGAELARVSVPTLVIEAPEDPINPPPHAAYLAEVIGSARRVTIPGMGHALSSPVLEPVAAAILAHTADVDAAAPPGNWTRATRHR